MARVEPVTEPVWLGEGPHWDHREQALYFVSIFDHTINKYVPATNKHTKAKLDGRVTFIIPVEGKPNHFVVGLGRKVVEVTWSGEPNTASVVRTVAEVDDQNPENRFNDAKADPRGRLFAGTMGHEYEPGKFHLKKGVLYRIDRDHSVHALVRDVDICNGLCWDLKEKAFYFADSFEYAVRRYDYDVETGDISNPTLVFVYKDHGLDGIVDGMTIDTDGNLWIANFDGSQYVPARFRRPYRKIITMPCLGQLMQFESTKSELALHSIMASSKWTPALGSCCRRSLFPRSRPLRRRSAGPRSTCCT